MRALTTIQSCRKRDFYPSFKIVYEWEDILAQGLGLQIKSDNKLWQKYYRRFEKNGLVWLYNAFLPKGDLHLDFVMEALAKKICRINKNTIPVIIDFWLKEEELSAFYEAYKHAPLVLLTNLEVYNLLKEHDCPFPIEHWPLSYPDQYAFSEQNNCDKQYDFCLFGRPNPFFVYLQEEYARRHPSFVYLKTKGTEVNREYYTSKGEFVCKDAGHQTYFDMIRKTRVSCYSTPGVDKAKKILVPFNQVTPRLFEMLCNGCQVIGHYPENAADVQWYNLKSVVPNVNNYDEFEQAMDNMLNNPVDFEKIKVFMNKHYTSTRIGMLRDILDKHGFRFR